MKKIYLDNAATTPLRAEVIQSMLDVLENDFGNPSSTHSFGRTAKNKIETSRKTIAKYLKCSAQEIIFTSNATEATNWILNQLIEYKDVKRIITSKIEHHATLYTINHLLQQHNIEVVYLTILPNGAVDLDQLEKLLENTVKTVVSLMHVNNEIGTVLDLQRVSKLCLQNNCYFHCDTVQSIGKTLFDLNELTIDFLVASAHKFHGPKGVGFAYINKKNYLNPMLYGGEQEKGLRAGTEATHQIVGMAKAIEIANENIEKEQKYISELKDYCLTQLKLNFDMLIINGENTFYNIINVTLPFDESKTSMILFNLDIKGIAVSRGSACQSGSIKPSHVLAEILVKENLNKPSLRISFSHYNTKNEIDYLIDVLAQMIQ